MFVWAHFGLLFFHTSTSIRTHHRPGLFAQLKISVLSLLHFKAFVCCNTGSLLLKQFSSEWENWVASEGAMLDAYSTTWKFNDIMCEYAKLMQWKGPTSGTQKSKPFALLNLFLDKGYIHIYMIHIQCIIFWTHIKYILVQHKQYHSCSMKLYALHNTYGCMIIHV